MFKIIFQDNTELVLNREDFGPNVPVYSSGTIDDKIVFSLEIATLKPIPGFIIGKKVSLEYLDDVMSNMIIEAKQVVNYPREPKTADSPVLVEPPSLVLVAYVLKSYDLTAQERRMNAQRALMGGGR